MATRTKSPDKTTRARSQAQQDEIVESYSDILTELRLLTTVSMLLFGFLLATARSNLSDTEKWLLFSALVAVATASALFVLPILYHRAQFPYDDWEKFQVRAHGFMRAGFPAFGLGFYLSLVVGTWEQVGEVAFAVATIPVVIAALALLFRRQLSGEE
jgi:hypothetical protein